MKPLKELFFSDVGADKQKFDPRKFFCTISFFLAIVDYILQMIGKIPANNGRVLGLLGFAFANIGFYQLNKFQKNGIKKSVLPDQKPFVPE